MKQEKGVSSAQLGMERVLDSLSAGKSAPKIGLVVLLVFYIAATIFVAQTSRSEDVIILMDQPVPLRSLTGAFSSIADLCVILLVVFYKKPGFIVALALLLLQFPKLFIEDMFLQHNPMSIAGVFTNLLSILAIVLLYANNVNIKKYQTRLHDQAVTDQLTGLPNRFACSELMDDLVKRGEKFVVAVLSLNNMRNIGNTMGQHTVDELLKEVADRFKRIADQGVTGTVDFITCQGGNDFVLVIRNYGSDDDAMKTLVRYEDELRGRVTVDECDYFLTADIGYAEFPSDAANSDALLACANSALSEAKRSNSDHRILRFAPGVMSAERAIEVERLIWAALENGTLYFDLQPQYDISHRLSGFEALARIRNADGSILSPAEFIPVAEKAGLIDKIDYIVFRDAAMFLGKLIEKTHTDVTLSVNVSVRHLMKNDFLDEVRSILGTCGVPANQLEIEITESIMIDSVERALECIGEIKEMGIKIAIDDFGTGYSSLSYLNNFPADLLKVDKSFIDRMNTSEESKQYVAAIISLGHVMNFDVISEGVEEPEQLDTLRAIGCDYIQGFIWGRPISPEAAEELVIQSVQ